VIHQHGNYKFDKRPHPQTFNGLFHILSIINTITYVYPFTHNKLFLLLIQHILHLLKLILGGGGEGFHCDGSLNVIISAYVRKQVSHMT
jgi:hypothetical protein